MDEHYSHPKLAEIYDLDSPWSPDRQFYLDLAGDRPRRILDLGCGTGLLCNAFATQNHDVTGVDPSPAMLAVARRKPHGNKIDWVQSSAQQYRSGKRFDLIIMTGHAFQVLLEDADIAQAFSTMRHHLSDGGIAVFESRNPAIDWRNQWDYSIDLDTPNGPVRESRKFLTMRDERMTFELSYQFADERLVSISELRFASRSTIEALLGSSGLCAIQGMGDWDSSPFDERFSREMILMVMVDQSFPASG